MSPPTDRQWKRYQKDLAEKIRRAAKVGKGAARQSRVTEENWDELIQRHGRMPREIASPAAAAAAQEYEAAAIVISVASGRCRVVLDGREIDAIVPPELAVQQKSALAVGDRVVLAEEGDVFRLKDVLPRHSVLARPDPINRHRQRLIAANIDLVVHVVSVKAPPLRPRLIDRFLIAIQRGGAQPVICVNKVDLLDEEERTRELAPLAAYRDLEVPIVTCSTKTGEGLEQLRDLVRGRTAALVGHSGVGKSSILNALDSQLQLATKTLHRRGTGRHSTTASTLYDFGDGTYLIDTPGIREFGLWNLDRESLRDYFPEFDEPSESCRFTDCSHIHEPDCAVRDAVESGTVAAARYDTYARLYHEVASDK